ncbi:hypothetical protein BDV25DRAFT_23317 [Aspergillus avenaceus]|uniref:Uncharacterized protein n=1 Tax=Aspergillus avenaceus TaxID=36643 RepID=A0A5N6TPH5_ASPAV|nr:hypothetical protein BDV25DRAFT_23317 [Aspergillus avenaceus]
MSVQRASLSPPSVEVIPLNLEHDGQPQFEPSFFEPYRGFLPEPDAEETYPPFTGVEGPFCKPLDWAQDINDYFQTYLATVQQETKLPIRLYQPGRFGHNLWERSPNSNWHISAFDYITDEPRFKCMMLNDVIGCDTVTREELLCICRIMVKVLRYYKNHLVAPVMVLSFMGPRHGRILVAHHNGDSLVIGKSELFDFQHKNIDAFKTFAQWWCSSGVGNTMAK